MEGGCRVGRGQGGDAIKRTQKKTGEGQAHFVEQYRDRLITELACIRCIEKQNPSNLMISSICGHHSHNSQVP